MTMQLAAETAMKFAERFGVPVVILGAILWMTREAATVLHDSVVVPVVKGHTEFLESTQKTLDEISHTQRSHAETLKELSQVQMEIRDAVIDCREQRDFQPKSTRQ
jgi:hypothetical protein